MSVERGSHQRDREGTAAGEPAQVHVLGPQRSSQGHPKEHVGNAINAPGVRPGKRTWQLGLDVEALQ